MTLSRTGATKALQLDAGYDRGSGMKMKIYSGTVPTNANTALGAQVLLGTLTLANTPFSAAVAAGNGATKTAGTIASDTDADAAGMAAFFRLTKSDDTVVAQGTVSASGGGGDAILDAISIQLHGIISCSSLVITTGA